MKSLIKILLMLVFSLIFTLLSEAIFAQDTENAENYPLLSQLWEENNGELIISEDQEMIREVTANEMFRALSRKGGMRLYIKFATGKHTILQESEAIIDQIVILLQDNPDLQLSIEGHTDNVGTPKNNKVLSEKRAKAVMKAIVDQGIDASRLSAVGWGQKKPVADNRTEEGRAKNRRIEIVNRVTI